MKKKRATSEVLIYMEKQENIKHLLQMIFGEHSTTKKFSVAQKESKQKRIFLLDSDY